MTVTALDAVAESISGGDPATVLAFIRIVGVDHLISAARPGLTTPMGVHQDLAADLRFDLLGENAPMLTQSNMWQCLRRIVVV